jgi:hypothetical protein
LIERLFDVSFDARAFCAVFGLLVARFTSLLPLSFGVRRH